MILTLTEAQAQLLKSLKISKFGGAPFKPHSAGEKLKFETDIVFEAFTRQAPGTLTQMGAFSYISQAPNGAGMIQLGRYCSVAPGLCFLNPSHPVETVTTNPYFYGRHYGAGKIPADFIYRGKRAPVGGSYGAVKLGHDVWIGAHCTIKGGVNIGHGAVIAGGANVVKDVEPYAIVGGNPAKLIRHRFAPALRARLLALAWWDISPRILRDLNFHDPEDFCTQ